MIFFRTRMQRAIIQPHSEIELLRDGALGTCNAISLRTRSTDSIDCAHFCFFPPGKQPQGTPDRRSLRWALLSLAQLARSTSFLGIFRNVRRNSQDALFVAYAIVRNGNIIQGLVKLAHIQIKHDIASVHLVEDSS